MTFNEIVMEIATRLEKTSPEAIARIGREVNIRYKRLTSTIGLVTSRRAVVTKAVTIGNRYVTFTSVEKLIAVIDGNVTPVRVLEEITFDEMRARTERTGDDPRAFAISRMGSTSVTVWLDSIPATAYTLTADAHEIKSTLTATDEPAFPESFHDVLVEGVLSDELRKTEKLPLAAAAKIEYEARLSDLRMWISKSTYKRIYQGKLAQSNGVNTDITLVP